MSSSVALASDVHGSWSFFDLNVVLECWVGAGALGCIFLYFLGDAGDMDGIDVKNWVRGGGGLG